MDEVKSLAIHSRIYTIFELMDSISTRNGPRSLEILNRFLEEEDKRKAPLQIMGMLNRQIRLLWQTKATLSGGGKPGDVTKRLGTAGFVSKNLIQQSRHWTDRDLERGLHLLHEADNRLKSGSRPNPILESLIMSLCLWRL